ncbi:hypothetical protein OCHUTO_0768 [Orientia chuto str. Dubai]|uniref:Uncharacterized protein n=1 Tax=Orientia chuto str. Dubai TaxID=1359168 RepID=A0A0F3MJ29_9RICK|nr:hypothetical protein [Candidatus Orientia mediorientalis]KJV55651.1 hypothetical protein OCHUTO_0768 [Orientia chuto str. Dubai]
MVYRDQKRTCLEYQVVEQVYLDKKYQNQGLKIGPYPDLSVETLEKKQGNSRHYWRKT